MYRSRGSKAFGLLPAASVVALMACDSLRPTEPAEAVRRVSHVSSLGTALCSGRGSASVSPTLALSRAAAAGVGATRVGGSGTARVTDPEGREFGAHFTLSASVGPTGSAHGSMNFSFGPDFSEVWAVAPGARSIHVRGKVTSLSGGDGGPITLGGTAAIETETFPGAKKIVFADEPFEISITGPGRFTFWWCEVPPMLFEVTTGQLSY